LKHARCVRQLSRVAEKSLVPPAQLLNASTCCLTTAIIATENVSSLQLAHNHVRQSKSVAAIKMSYAAERREQNQTAAIKK
jgi:hypothetical protein